MFTIAFDDWNMTYLCMSLSIFELGEMIAFYYNIFILHSSSIMY